MITGAVLSMVTVNGWDSAGICRAESVAVTITGPVPSAVNPGMEIAHSRGYDGGAPLIL